MDTRYLLGILVAVIMVWFAAGIIYNLRRGKALLRWMQGGLPKIGERTTLRWLGSSVAELVIEKAQPPFRRFETLVVLAPRDVPWMWIWAFARGRRDMLILRCQLQNAPKVMLELVDPASWTGRHAVQDVARQGWEMAPHASATAAGARLQLLAPQGRTDAAATAVPGLLAIAAQFGPRLPSRLSVRRDPSSLEVHLPFPNTRQTDAGEFFDALQSMARAVTE